MMSRKYVVVVGCLIVGILAGAAGALAVNRIFSPPTPEMSYERAREIPAHHLPAPSSLNV